MTLALTGKSRRRQTALLIAAFLALIGAIAASIASSSPDPARADAEPYSATMSLADHAGGDTTLRPFEWATAEFTLSLPASVPLDELLIEADATPEVQFAGFQRFGLMNDLDCNISIVGFSCISADGAAEGLYRITFLVRHRTSACVSGPVNITTFVTHPDDPGSPRAFASQSLTIDCTAPPLLAPEVQIGVQMLTGNPPGAVPFFVSITEPDEPTYERYPTFGLPTMFTTTPGSTYVTLEPPGGMEVMDVTCTGLGSLLRTGNQIRLTLENGEASDCAFLLRAPVLHVAACYEGPLGGLASGARWGFSSENFNDETPVTENQVIPAHPDHPVPFDDADFLAKSGQGWQWSGPIAWDPQRDFIIDWDVRYGIGTHLGVSIKLPSEAVVTAENQCQGAETLVVFPICSELIDDGVEPLETFSFSYYLDGEFKRTISVREGQYNCELVSTSVSGPDDEVVIVQEVQSEWLHAPGYPKRQVKHTPDPVPPGPTGSSLTVVFPEPEQDGSACVEANGPPQQISPCTVEFVNAAGDNSGPFDLAIVVCQDTVDTTGVNLPAVFTYAVNGQLLTGNVDANGVDHNTSCQPAYFELPNLDQPVLVEQFTPATWQNAPGYPLRRVIHYQDNPQANQPGASVLVQFAEGKGGGIICYQPGIEGIVPNAIVSEFPGTGLGCHVIFENVRTESTETPTPTPTQPSADPTEDPTQSPTQPVEEATVTPSPTATTAAPKVESPTVTDPDPLPDGGTAEPDASPTEPTSGEGGGETTPPAAEETVAGERTAAPGITPVAPATGDTAEFAGQPASIWAVLACFLFAASLAFTAAAFWKQK